MKKIFLILMLLCNISLAGEFTVTPIRIDLDRENQSNSITVSNDGKKPINFVIKEMMWQQDKDGNDIYNSSQDLIYFPKSFKLEGGTSRIIRVGLKNPDLPLKERAYRLFIEEIPEGKLEGQTGVAIAIRFGVPIFIKPVNESFSVKLDNITFHKDKTDIIIKNLGNISIRFNSIELIGLNDKGNEIYKKQINGWYVFPDVNKKFSAPITYEECINTKKLIILLNTDNKVVREELNVEPTQCKN